MQLTTGFLSVLLLASGAIPSVVAVAQRPEKTKTVFRTKTQWKTITQKTLYSKTTTITSTRPWTVEETRRTTVISTTIRKQFEGGPVKAVIVTKTISTCEPIKPTIKPVPEPEPEPEPKPEPEPEPETEEPTPTDEGDKEENPYSTCPPVATVTAMKKCDASKPPCPRERKCVAGQAMIMYGCNCLTAPPRTTTITTACPDECCGGYFPPRYHLLVDGKCPTGTMTAAPEIAETRPPKLPPITVSDDEPEEEETEDQVGDDFPEDDDESTDEEPKKEE